VTARRVAIVGGGLTGLATAWHLRDDVEVEVFEAASRVGGQIHTIELAGEPLDVGADAFLARQPEAERLAREVGFGDDDMVAPATGQVWLWLRGRLRPLPAATVLGVPAQLRPLARSGVLRPAELARAAVEPLLPRRHVPGDRSVADLVGERFGPAVVDRLVEPLLAGVYAGNAGSLSAQAAAPPVWSAAREHRSVLRGLAAHRERAVDDDRPVFKTLRGGLGTLTGRLADELGAQVRVGTAIRGLAHDGRRWRVRLDTGAEPFDAVVLAVPAAVAADLLASTLPEVARELAGIRSASVGVVALAYDPRDAQRVPPGSGILVPRSEGRLVKAVTVSSRKWPHQAAPDRFVLRASVGRVDDPGALSLDDDEVLERVDAEVRWALRLARPARERRLVRWPAALPQYDVGHHARLDRIRTHLETEAPAGLHLGGAAFDGVGLAARARDASRLAEEVRAVTVPGAAERGAPPAVRSPAPREH
jgi:protoporphyrinogen/coproporphyrinogen III oxidase